MSQAAVAGVQQSGWDGGGVAAFLEQGVSVVASSGDSAHRPVLSRALACRLDPEGRRATVLLAAAPAAALLDAVAETGRIAVAVTLPSTHRSVQIKGTDARVVQPPADAGAMATAHLAAFIADLEIIGFQPDFVATLMACDPDDVVAIVFTASAVFDQTPGPRAGDAVVP